MDELWRELGQTESSPAADVRAVKARVHAALDADPIERKVYMKQKVRFSLAAAAIAVAVTGSALAVTANLDVLQAFFQGDTSPAQEYMDNTVRSVSDENYTLTVESSVSDKNAAYLVVTVKALNEETKEFLFSEDFNDMDTFSFYALRPAQDGDEDWGDQVVSNGTSYGEERDARTEDSIRWHMALDISKPGAATVRARLGWMEKGKFIEVPLSPAPTATVEIGASGQGIKDMETVDEPGTLTVDRVELTPFTCRIETSGEPITRGYEANPRLLFRMADGSIRTQSQLMEYTGGSTDGGDGTPQDGSGVTRGKAVHNYRLYAVQDLAGLQSVIVFDREYPLDGSASKPVAHDAALDPFELPTMASLGDQGGYSIPVRALTEKLGGTCDWDAATGSTTCVYRGVTIVLTPGSGTALVDGQSKALLEIPAVQNGSLAANHQVFFDAWGLDGFVLRHDEGEHTVYTDWYIVP